MFTKATPVTTTIGENITTNDLAVTGNVTSGNWQGTAIDTEHGGTGQDWSTATQGNLPYFSETGTLSNLAPGEAGQFLTSGGEGADPAWANVTRSATFVVAASDSSELSKQQADYVCDGVDDQIEIQAAIDALPSGGGTITLSSGSFFQSSPITITKPTAFSGYAAIFTNVGAITGAWSVEADDVVFDGITFNAPSGSYHHTIRGSITKNTHNVIIRNCKFIGATRSGADQPVDQDDSTMSKAINVGAAIGWIIEANYFEKCGYEAISATELTESTILKPSSIIVRNNRAVDCYRLLVFEGQNMYSIADGNIAINCSDMGILIWHRGTNHIKITNNILIGTDAARAGIFTDAPISRYMFHGMISGNTIVNFREGIKGTMGFIDITDNTIVSSGYDEAVNYGIFVNGNSKNTIRGNRIYGFRYGINSGEALVSGNFLYNSFSTGYAIYESNIVEGNYLYNCLSGIVIRDSTKIIRNNILLSESVDSTILSETISAGAVTGVVADTSQFYVMEDITTTPTVGVPQHNKIKSIDYNTNTITLLTALDADYEIGDTFVQRKIGTNGLLPLADSSALVTDNHFTGYAVPIWTPSRLTNVFRNFGWTTENSGVSTIATTTTSIVVTHGLATTPTRVQLTPTTDTGGKRYWISEKTATTFTITIDSAHTSDISFDWRATVGEGN
ncbi:MAG: hypothetical protein WC178_00205 [Candidatus Paceibacterota bacterium]